MSGTFSWRLHPIIHHDNDSLGGEDDEGMLVRRGRRGVSILPGVYQGGEVGDGNNQCMEKILLGGEMIVIEEPLLMIRPMLHR